MAEEQRTIEEQLDEEQEKRRAELGATASTPANDTEQDTTDMGSL